MEMGVGSAGFKFYLRNLVYGGVRHGGGREGDK